MQTATPILDLEMEDTLAMPETLVPEIDPAVQHQKARELARLIDVHLDYERQSRLPLSMDELTPRRLCPEQRVDLVTDLYAVAR